MHRQIVYVGQIPQDTDLLLQNRNAMTALGYALQAILGTNTVFDGLPCTPNTPAALNVLVGGGSVYSLQNVDGTAYGSLAADTTNQIVKQGIVQGTTTLSTPAPATPGQSINYLVQATYQDQDGDSTVLPYYNASNPAVAYSGPNNSGVSQNTVRKGVCVITVKAGTPATTGTQTTPAPDAGYTGLYSVTVANGQTTVTSGNIQQLATAPFIAAKLPSMLQAIQQDTPNFAQDTSLAANTITVSLSPAPAALTNGMVIRVKIANSSTGATVMNVNGLGNVACKTTSGADFGANTVVANGIYTFAYDANGTRFQLQGFTAATATGLIPANNLSDVLSAAASLANLGTSKPVQSSFKSYTATWASNSTLTLTADEITVEDSSGNTARITGLNVTINTATTGANGCDAAFSSFSANSWAYAYAIEKPDGTVAGLLSASATAPTLPSGYTFKSGAMTPVRLDGSKNIVGFKQVGRKWQYLVGSNLSAPPQVCTGAQGTYGSASVAVPVTGAVPTAVASHVKFLYAAVASNNYSMAVSPNANYGHGGVSMTNPPYFGNPYGGVCQAVSFEMLLESTSIRVESEANATLLVLGFDVNA